MVDNPALIAIFAREAAQIADQIEQRLQTAESTGEMLAAPNWSHPPQRDPSIPSTAMHLDYQLNGQHLQLIHLENEEGDWLWVDPQDTVPVFGSTDALQRYAVDVGPQVSDTYPGQYRLDLIGDWLRVPDTRSIGCQPSLYCWQLFDTLAASVGVPLHGGDLNRVVYQHLWVGVYAVPDRMPRWRTIEPAYTSHHLGWGLELFKAHTHPVQ